MIPIVPDIIPPWANKGAVYSVLYVVALVAAFALGIFESDWSLVIILVGVPVSILSIWAILYGIIYTVSDIVERRERRRWERQEAIDRANSEEKSRLWKAVIDAAKEKFHLHFPQLDAGEREKFFGELIRRGHVQAPNVASTAFRPELLTMELPTEETGLLVFKYGNEQVLTATVFQGSGELKLL